MHFLSLAQCLWLAAAHRGSSHGEFKSAAQLAFAARFMLLQQLHRLEEATSSIASPAFRVLFLLLGCFATDRDVSAATLLFPVSLNNLKYKLAFYIKQMFHTGKSKLLQRLFSRRRGLIVPFHHCPIIM